MKINKNQFMSFEGIDFQDASYFHLLSGLIAQYKNKELDRKTFQEKVSDSIRKRFNFSIKFEVHPVNEVNAYMMPYELDPANILTTNRNRKVGELILGQYKRYTIKENAKLMRSIVKGDLSASGWLDYKKARCGGLFSQLPPALSVCYQGTIDNLEPDEVSAIILHELGHYWTYLEWLGIYTSRNAIIVNAISEFLNAKSEQEKFQVVLEAKNAWGLRIEESQVAKLNDENATKILTGSFNHVFKNSVGYVQYDENVSEVIADQFAIRMGASKASATGMYKLASKYNQSDEAVTMNNITIMGCVISTVGTIISIAGPIVFPPLGPLLSVVGGFLGVLGAQSIISGLFGITSSLNGGAYDFSKNRLERMYREEVQRLKMTNPPIAITKTILNSLEEMKRCIEMCGDVEKVWGASVMRFFSADFREQEQKKYYQQLIEEMLSNQLYVTANKFKTLGVN